MRYFGVLTLAGILFFFPIALIYGLLSDWEWVGTLATSTWSCSGAAQSPVTLIPQRSKSIPVKPAPSLRGPGGRW